MSLIGRQRLVRQRVVAADFASAGEVVAHLGAMQGQDFAGVKWSIGARMAKATEAEIEGAFDRGEILRTWPMRGTIHVVAPADVRWIMDLLRPRIYQKNAGRYRELGLDDAVLGSACETLGKALSEERALTRSELVGALAAAGIDSEGQRMAYILQRAGVEKVLCFGPRRGKEFTYVALDPWAPVGRSWDRDEALRELTLRYFRSRGPATAADFAWWAGLTISEVKGALNELRGELVENEGFWGPPGEEADGKGGFTIPGFDEFFLGYQDRDPVLDPAFATRVVPGGNGVFNPVIVVDGQIVGVWRRNLKKGRVEITADPFAPLAKKHGTAFERAARRYAEFLGLEPVFSRPE